MQFLKIKIFQNKYNMCFMCVWSHNTIDSPSNFSWNDFFFGKNDSFEIFAFFTGISHIHVLNFKPALTSYFTLKKKK